MKQKNFLKIAMLFVFAMISNFSYGQLVTTIDFETEDAGYTPSAKTGSGNTDAFNRTNTGVNGNSSFYWVAEDLSGNPSIDLAQINITGSTSFTFAVDLSYDNAVQWDSSDELIITYSIDGGAFQNLMAVQHINTDGFNNPAALDFDFDGNGDSGQELSITAFNSFTTGSIALSSNTTLDIKLQFNNLTSNGEGVFMDNIIITETAASSDPTIGFDAATSSQTETDATFNVSIPITVSNYGTDQIDVSVAVSGTAEVADYTLNTASLSFTADGTQNISLDINDDADSDAETVILTITETSAVSGLVISQSTHTVTITDDEVPPVPTAGTVFITEVSDAASSANEYIEIYNNSNESVSVSTSKLVMLNSGGTVETIWDFDDDIGVTALNTPADGSLTAAESIDITITNFGVNPQDDFPVSYQIKDGAIITETLFSWDGLGMLLVNSIQSRDYPITQACIFIIAISYVLVNLITEIFYKIVDPRMRDT
jgi:hypothetical protein